MEVLGFYTSDAHGSLSLAVAQSWRSGEKPTDESKQVHVRPGPGKLKTGFGTLYSKCDNAQ